MKEHYKLFPRVAVHRQQQCESPTQNGTLSVTLTRGMLDDCSHYLLFQKWTLPPSKIASVTALNDRGLSSEPPATRKWEQPGDAPVSQIPDSTGLSQQLHLASCQKEVPEGRAPR